MKQTIIDARIQELNDAIESAEYTMQDTKKQMAAVLTADNETIVGCMMEYSKEFNQAYFWAKRNRKELKVLESIKREVNQ